MTYQNSLLLVRLWYDKLDSSFHLPAPPTSLKLGMISPSSTSILLLAWLNWGDVNNIHLPSQVLPSSPLFLLLIFWLETTVSAFDNCINLRSLTSSLVIYKPLILSPLTNWGDHPDVHLQLQIKAYHSPFFFPWTTKYPRYIQLHSVASTCAGHQAAWFPHQASFPYIPQPGCPLFLLFCSLHLQFLTMTLTCVRHRVAWCSSKASFPYIPQPECTSCSQPTYWSIPHQLSFLESFAVYNVHCTYNMLSITFTPDLGQDLFHPADNLVLSLSLLSLH